MFAPIPAPNVTSSNVTFWVDNRVASASGNLIVLGAVVPSAERIIEPEALPVNLSVGE